MKRILVVLLILLFSPCLTKAQQWNITTTIRSYHFSGDYNNWNLGLGIGRKMNKDITWESGFYYNSERDFSFYSSAVFQHPKDTFLSIGTSIGLVTGYNRAPVLPLLNGGIIIGRNPELRIIYIPTANNGLVNSQISISLP